MIARSKVLNNKYSQQMGILNSLASYSNENCETGEWNGDCTPHKHCLILTFLIAVSVANNNPINNTLHNSRT